ncbi:unnamed protein product [Rotaria sp. Silwood1]|nr:unnamed protein product [Rotaria sp. Silwood1]
MYEHRSYNFINILDEVITSSTSVTSLQHIPGDPKFLTEYPNAYLIGTRDVVSNEKLNKHIHVYFSIGDLTMNIKCPPIEPFEWPFDEIDFYCF